MPTIRRQGKRAQRPRQLDEAEEQANIILHLRDGHGFEFVWHGDLAFQEHHRTLTVAVLRRLWPKYRTRILGERRDPGTMPFGWWITEAAPAARAEYLAAWRRHYDYDDDYADDDETFTETQARLLRQAGLLEDPIDGDENDSREIDHAALPDMPAGDGAHDTVATLPNMPGVLEGDAGADTTADNIGDRP